MGSMTSDRGVGKYLIMGGEFHQCDGGGGVDLKLRFSMMCSIIL